MVAVSERTSIGDRPCQLIRRVRTDDHRLRIADTHRHRRTQRRRGDRHHPVREFHDLAGDAVADRQPDDPRRLAIGKVVEHVVPVGRSERPGCLREVADDRHRSVEGAASGHLELHRREVLDLVDDDVTVRADLVGVVDLAVAAGLGAEHVAGVVEQGDIGRSPPHVVDRLRTRTEQRQRLGFVEHAASGELEQRLRPEQVVQELGRREQRPHPVECLADLRGSPEGVLHRQRTDLRVVEARGERRPQLVLDELASAVVATEATTSSPDDPRRLLGSQPDVPGTERDDEVVAQRSFTVGDRLIDDIGHPNVTLETSCGRAVGARPVVGSQELHARNEVGQHHLLDTGLAERRQHSLDVAQEHSVRADHQHALVLQRKTVGVEQVGGSVERNDGLAGAGSALDHEDAVLRAIG